MDILTNKTNGAMKIFMDSYTQYKEKETVEPGIIWNIIYWSFIH